MTTDEIVASLHDGCIHRGYFGQNGLDEHATNELMRKAADHIRDLEDAIKQAAMLGAAASTKQSGWISVNERVPEDGCEVVIRGLSGDGTQYIRAAIWYAHEKNFRWHTNHQVAGNVTDWQPLPE